MHIASLRLRQIRHIDKQIDREIDKQIDKQIDRQIDRGINKYGETEMRSDSARDSRGIKSERKKLYKLRRLRYYFMKREQDLQKVVRQNTAYSVVFRWFLC